MLTTYTFSSSCLWLSSSSQRNTRQASRRRCRSCCSNKCTLWSYFWIVSLQDSFWWSGSWRYHEIHQSGVSGQRKLPQCWNKSHEGWDVAQWQKACLTCTKPLVCSSVNTYVPHNLMCILGCPSQEGLLREMGATYWLRLPSGLCLYSWGNGCLCGAWRKEHLQVAHLTISPKGDNVWCYVFWD